MRGQAQEKEILTRFLTITKKPFTLLEFVMATGIEKKKSLIILKRAEGEKSIGMIQKGRREEDITFITYPPKRPKHQKQYNFKPKREKLEQITEAMGADEILSKQEIRRRTGLNNTTFDRYFRTLIYMGSIKKVGTEQKTKGRGRREGRYIKTGKGLPAELPYFYGEVRRGK